MFRTAVQPIRRRSAPQSSTALMAFPAAVAGWVSNQNIAAPQPGPQGAAVLDNIFPTATGGILRRGSSIYATLGAGVLPVTALFSYNNGNNRKLFAANEETVYDITIITSPINYTLSTEGGDDIVTDTGDYLGQLSPGGLEVIENANGGNWIDTQFATTGGTFLIIVNGADKMFLYDGSLWFPIDEFGIYTLDFDAEVSAFEAGETVTGGTSGATGYIAHVDSNGSTGRLYLADAVGIFQDNETLTSASGEATANGVATAYYTGIDGVDTEDLDYVWVYKNRLFFVEKDSMNAWYLPIDQVGGTAEVFPLGGVFTLGGKLLFGASWSLDSSGEGGLSEQCVFISDQGEVAVYQGLSPEDANWTKVGTYRIGKPLGRNAWFRAGGDMVIATDIGDIPLSQAIQRDYAALAPAAVSFPIETAWNDAVALRRASEWHQIIWPENQMVLVALPTINQQPPEMFVANARTGAWAKFTNWDGTCLEVFNGRLFFGSTGGKVIEANVTGLDQDQTYTGVYVPLFTDLGTPASRKIPRIARSVTRGPQESVNPQLSVSEDYIVDLPPPPAASSIQSGSQWGVGIWGQAVWGEQQSLKIHQSWTSVSGYFYAGAPAWQLTSGSLVPLDEEVVRLEVTYETAAEIT